MTTVSLLVGPSFVLLQNRMFSTDGDLQSISKNACMSYEYRKKKDKKKTDNQMNRQNIQREQPNENNWPTIPFIQLSKVHSLGQRI